MTDPKAPGVGEISWVDLTVADAPTPPARWPRCINRWYSAGGI
ncbi:MAG: hypothetical protein ABI968_13180 [Acidobacteriota bacterium]